MKFIKKSLGILLAIVLLYIGLLIYPNPLFSNKYTYENFTVYSDRVIPSEIESVLDKTKQLLSKSEIYHPTDQFYIYFCNSSWRFQFFGRNKNAGGVVMGILSGNVFIRIADIKADKIIPPNGWMFNQKERPLSYFLAHELTHSCQAFMDRFMILKVTGYIMEGYADYIGKANSFNYKRYCQEYLDQEAVMDPKNGLYNKYHLYIAYLMDKKEYTFEQIVAEQPELEAILQEACRN